jgi:hypothetical protein
MWRVWRKEEMHIGFGGESCGDKPLRRPRRRWEDNIKVDFKQML